jgi:hypothetical protein
MIKGLAAGTVNAGFAMLSGAAIPAAAMVGASAMVGFIGIGISLVLFVLALRHLGTARTSAYFSLAPFIGAVLAIGLLHEAVSVNLALAVLLRWGSGYGCISPNATSMSIRMRRSNTSTAIDTTRTTGTRMTGRSANRIRIGTATRRYATPTRITLTCITGMATAEPRHRRPVYWTPSDYWIGGGTPKLGWNNRRRKPGAKALSGLTETCGSAADPVTW